MFFLEIENLWDPVHVPVRFSPYALIPARRVREGISPRVHKHQEKV